MVEKKERKKSSTMETNSAPKQDGSIPFMTRGRDCASCNCGNNDIAGLTYVLGVIGAIAYYVSTASTFWMGVVGVLKALVWPAFVVFELMQMLGM